MSDNINDKLTSEQLIQKFASINNIVLKDEYKDLYKLIVALLNSNVINWYYANNFSNKSTLTVNISKTATTSIS